LAAYFGRVNIVEELLNKGSKVDDAIESGDATPLQMASLKGHVKVMNKLIRRGANPNAMAKEIGPVINAAIYSGNREAVKLLVQQGVSLTHTDNDVPTPLVLAALFSDSDMFNYLLETCGEQLPPQEYDKALEAAAEAGGLDVVNTLLKHPHSTESFQKALDNAAEESNWDTVLVLLDHSRGLDCNELFYSVAVDVEQQDRVLEAIWLYTNGGISDETLNKSLYDATDNKKEPTVRLLLESFKADPNKATGDECVLYFCDRLKISLTNRSQVRKCSDSSSIRRDARHSQDAARPRCRYRFSEWVGPTNCRSSGTH
jgi:ankyrin repeat protein